MRIIEEALCYNLEKIGISSNSFFISNKGYPFSKFSSIYTFNTESLPNYISSLDLRDKNVLVPFGSGDHIIAAKELGAKSVDGFDLNYNQYLFGSLKLAAFTVLTEEEFILYFVHTLVKEINGKLVYQDNPYIMKQTIYHKFRHLLPKEVRFFWDTLYACCDGYAIAHSHLFDKDNICYSQIVYNNHYLQKGNYKKIQQQILAQPFSQFILSNVTTLASKIIKKYDVILLSNISSYANMLFQNDTLQQFKSLVVHDLASIVKPGGKIVFAYIYDYDKNYSLDENSFFNKKAVNRVFSGPQFQTMVFPSNWVEGTDAIKIYTKER